MVREAPARSLSLVCVSKSPNVFNLAFSGSGTLANICVKVLSCKPWKLVLSYLRREMIDYGLYWIALRIIKKATELVLSANRLPQG